MAILLASEMTYIVSSGALNSTHSLTHASNVIRHIADSTERYAVNPDNSSGLGITIYF